MSSPEFQRVLGVRRLKAGQQSERVSAQVANVEVRSLLDGSYMHG